MRIKSLIDEDFVNYKKPSMFLSACFCDWKCCKEAGVDVCICQNADAYNMEIVNIPDDTIVKRYVANDITKAIVIGGFEPFLQFDELYSLVRKFRENTNDDIIIYTGFYRREVEKEVKKLSEFDNVYIKFGRYVPNGKKHFDELLGIYLANEEQKAEKI